MQHQLRYRDETQLKIECTFYSPFISSSYGAVPLPHLLCFPLSLSVFLSLSVCLPLADSVFVAVASRRCDRMKYCPEGRYNFDAFTTFRVLVIIGSLCLEVSFMIAFLFSCLGFFSLVLCWLLCYVLLIVELVCLAWQFLLGFR